MQDKVIFRPVAPEEIPALVRLRLQTRIETYSEIYPREWIEGFDVAASEERFRKIAVDPDQRLCFIEVDGAYAGYLCLEERWKRPCRRIPSASTCSTSCAPISAGESVHSRWSMCANSAARWDVIDSTMAATCTMLARCGFIARWAGTSSRSSADTRTAQWIRRCLNISCKLREDDAKKEPGLLPVLVRFGGDQPKMPRFWMNAESKCSITPP